MIAHLLHAFETGLAFAANIQALLMGQLLMLH
jgi:hypothetical protein